MRTRPTRRSLPRSLCLGGGTWEEGVDNIITINIASLQDKVAKMVQACGAASIRFRAEIQRKTIVGTLQTCEQSIALRALYFLIVRSHACNGPTT